MRQLPTIVFTLSVAACSTGGTISPAVELPHDDASMAPTSASDAGQPLVDAGDIRQVFELLLKSSCRQIFTCCSIDQARQVSGSDTLDSCPSGFRFRIGPLLDAMVTDVEHGLLKIDSDTLSRCLSSEPSCDSLAPVRTSSFCAAALVGMLPAGSACDPTHSWRCAPDTVCRRAGDAYACRKNLMGGEACSGGGCAPGLTCLASGSCGEVLEPGAACTADSECASFHCMSGKCTARTIRDATCGL